MGDDVQMVEVGEVLAIVDLLGKYRYTVTKRTGSTISFLLRVLLLHGPWQSVAQIMQIEQTENFCLPTYACYRLTSISSPSLSMLSGYSIQRPPPLTCSKVTTDLCHY